MVKGSVYDGLDISNFPEKYKFSLLEESKYVRNISKGVVLDVGCGNGRIIQFLDGKSIKEYIGFELNPSLIEKAMLIETSFLKRFVQGDAHNLSSFFSGAFSDVTISTFATLGLLDERRVLSEMIKVSKDKIFFTLNKKGALKVRLKYYQNSGIRYTFDEETESIFSDVWGEVKAYSLKELEELGKSLGLKLVDSGSFGEVLVYGFFQKF